jgi:formylglycine-generating enzyme required for sulfatase activity
MVRATSIRAASRLALALAIASCGPGATGARTGPPATPEPQASGVAVTVAPTASPATPAEPSPVRDPGTVRTDAHGVNQAWVPGGVFRMGSEEGSATPPPWAAATFRSEHPAHEVALSRGFWIDVTEVTVGEFTAFKEAGGYDDPSTWSAEGWAWRQSMGASPLPRPCLEQGLTPDLPQVCVTWYEAEAYATWRGGRLPTEAEWEFAARGPESRVYPWGDEFDSSLANLDGAAGPVAVGSYPKGASWVGALDMAGNAMEWVADWWSRTYYAEKVRDDPTGPARGNIKVEKGGWWGPPDDAGAFIARAAFRLDEDPPTYSDHHIGFRVVIPS